VVAKKIIEKITTLYKSRWYFSLAVIFSILIVYMFLAVKNHRFWMHDFEVYHKAASRVIDGENLYRGDIDGFYKYKYSPTCAAYFIPMGALPFSIAKVVYWILLSALICLGFYLALKIAMPDFSGQSPVKINGLIFLMASILAVHYERELHLGQVNHLILVCYLAVVYYWRQSRNILSALLWAGSIFIKPFGLIFLPYFIYKREFHLIGWFILTLILFALVPVLFYGWQGMLGQYSGWFGELSAELVNKQDLLQPGNHTIFSILARFTPFRLLDFSPTVTHAYQLSILIALAILFWAVLKKGRGLAENRSLESAALIALIPLLAFTSQNAFGFLELGVAVILVHWGELPRWGKAVSICSFVFSGGNIHDIVGKTLWNFFSDISLVAWGAAILLGVLILLRYRKLA